MITYLTGDATEPVKKPALIMHVCNDVGGWGRGFVLALSKKWKEPESRYRRASHYDLGYVQFAPCVETAGDEVIVANMIAQHDIAARHGIAPVRYDALAGCLTEVDRFTQRWYQRTQAHLTVHAPRIGCGLAGGSWSVVEPLIEFYLKDREVYVYDLPEE